MSEWLQREHRGWARAWAELARRRGDLAGWEYMGTTDDGGHEFRNRGAYPRLERIAVDPTDFAAVTVPDDLVDHAVCQGVAFERKEGRCGGQWTFANSRLTVETIDSWFRANVAPSEIQKQYPHKTIDEIEAAIALPASLGTKRWLAGTFSRPSGDAPSGGSATTAEEAAAVAFGFMGMAEEIRSVDRRPWDCGDCGRRDLTWQKRCPDCEHRESTSACGHTDVVRVLAEQEERIAELRDGLRAVVDAWDTDEEMTPPCERARALLEKTSKGGTTMRATGEKPDPVGGQHRRMAGNRSDDRDYSKRAPAAGLGREPKASDEVQPPRSSASSDEERADDWIHDALGWQSVADPVQFGEEHDADVASLAALLADVRRDERQRVTARAMNHLENEMCDVYTARARARFVRECLVDGKCRRCAAAKASTQHQIAPEPDKR